MVGRATSCRMLKLPIPNPPFVNFRKCRFTSPYCTTCAKSTYSMLFRPCRRSMSCRGCVHVSPTQSTTSYLPNHISAIYTKSRPHIIYDTRHHVSLGAARQRKHQVLRYHVGRVRLGLHCASCRLFRGLSRGPRSDDLGSLSRTGEWMDGTCGACSAVQRSKKSNRNTKGRAGVTWIGDKARLRSGGCAGVNEGWDERGSADEMVGRAGGPGAVEVV